MTVNSILVSLDEVKNLLTEVDIFKSENNSRKRSVGNDKFSPEFLSVMFDDDYELIYKTAMKHLDYDFLLEDDAFFQFSVKKGNINLKDGKLRYAYYPNPREYNTYLEFLSENNLSYDECGDCFNEEYDQYISEAKLKNSITPIRYDYDFSEYDSSKHPISHLHIGMDQTVRIPIARIITPQEFTILILRNVYFENWTKVLNSESYIQILNKSKNDNNILEDEYFKSSEKRHLYLF